MPAAPRVGEIRFRARGGHQPGGELPGDEARGAGDAASTPGQHRDHRERGVGDREHDAGGLHLLQARRAGTREERGAGAGPVRDTRQLRVALRAAHAAGDEGVRHEGGGAFGQHGGARYAQGGEAQGGGRGGGGGVPGQRRVPIREWAQPYCGRGVLNRKPLARLVSLLHSR